MHDAVAREKIAKCPGVAVAWWLMASYLYYCRHVSLLSDAYYDELSEWLDRHWDGIEHQHKHLVEREALSAGTGFYLAERDYPLRTRCAAEQLARELGIEIDRPAMSTVDVSHLLNSPRTLGDLLGDAHASPPPSLTHDPDAVYEQLRQTTGRSGPIGPAQGDLFA